MAKLNIADIRQEYTKGGLRESELPGDPLSLFSRWLQEAIDAEVDEPTAVIVGTVSPEGRPSTRTVLLKGLHDGKFIFYTNYESRKGKQLAQNPSISLSFVWHALERQIHIEGIATKVSPEESDEYFYIPCNRTGNGKSVVLLLDFVDFSWQLQLEYVILQL